MKLLLLSLLLAGCVARITPAQVAAATEPCNSHAHGGWVYLDLRTDANLAKALCRDGTETEAYHLSTEVAR